MLVLFETPAGYAIFKVKYGIMTAYERLNGSFKVYFDEHECKMSVVVCSCWTRRS